MDLNGKSSVCVQVKGGTVILSFGSPDDLPAAMSLVNSSNYFLSSTQSLLMAYPNIHHLRHNHNIIGTG